jgi:putative transcriptional regulator
MRIMPKQSKTQFPPSQPGMSQGKTDFSDSTSQKDGSDLSLANHFLIAMPSMLDPVFGGTVVYLCEHNANGALGVIINKPTDMTMDVLLDRIDLKLEIVPNKKQMAEKPVMFGGPVQVERGFVLHTPLGKFSSMIEVAEDVTLTTSKDVLEAVASGNGPSRVLVTLGCAGWSAGQLESEIARNGWLTVRADPAILFDMPIAERFAAAIKLLGIDPSMLASEAGHA